MEQQSHESQEKSTRREELYKVIEKIINTQTNKEQLEKHK